MDVWNPIIVALITTLIAPAIAKVVGMMWQAKMGVKDKAEADLTAEVKEQTVQATRAQMKVLVLEEELGNCYRELEQTNHKSRNPRSEEER